jgi:hypothetical protein
MLEPKSSKAFVTKLMNDPTSPTCTDITDSYQNKTKESNQNFPKQKIHNKTKLQMRSQSLLTPTDPLPPRTETHITTWNSHRRIKIEKLLFHDVHEIKQRLHWDFAKACIELLIALTEGWQSLTPSELIILSTWAFFATSAVYDEMWPFCDQNNKQTIE